MKFGIFSDLHMEFEPWFFEPDPDVFYLNAGDTHPQYLMRDYFFSLFKNDNLFSVMGNHDFYGSSGSVYNCHKNGYGLRMSTVDTYTTMKKTYPDQVEMLEDCDWTQMEWK